MNEPGQRTGQLLSLSLSASDTLSKQGRNEVAMGRARAVKKGTEVVTGKSRPKEMSHSEDSRLFSLTALVLVAAVFVAPLTALSTCKYTRLLNGGKKRQASAPSQG